MFYNVPFGSNVRDSKAKEDVKVSFVCSQKSAGLRRVEVGTRCCDTVTSGWRNAGKPLRELLETAANPMGLCSQ